MKVCSTIHYKTRILILQYTFTRWTRLDSVIRQTSSLQILLFFSHVVSLLAAGYWQVAADRWLRPRLTAAIPEDPAAAAVPRGQLAVPRGQLAVPLGQPAVPRSPLDAAAGCPWWSWPPCFPPGSTCCGCRPPFARISPEKEKANKEKRKRTVKWRAGEVQL